MISSYFKHESADFETDLFSKGNQLLETEEELYAIIFEYQKLSGQRY